MDELYNKEFKSNSHTSKEKETQAPEKKVTKVVSGPVKIKKNELRKFTDIFISEDISNVRNYIFMDVLVPAIKKAVSDIVTNGIDMILYGDGGRSRRNTNAASNVSYRNYYDQRRDDEHRYSSTPAARAKYNYNDITIPTRGEAEEVLLRMDELIDTYGIASVADLYDLVGITGDYTDNKYGWTNIRSAEVVRVRDGYMLRLPKALPIN